MSGGVHIAGMGRVADVGAALSLDRIIGDAVAAALADAACTITEVDSVVGLGNDADDGGLAPLLKAETAGAWGRSYLHLTGSAGQALSSGWSLVAAGLARRVLAVGWHPGSRAAVAANRGMTAEPFYMRPVGATPDVLAALQARMLSERGLAADDAPERPSRDGLDMACAVVLEGQARTADAIVIEGCGQSFAAYLPDDDFDPAAWIGTALERSGDDRQTQFGAVAVSAASAPVRARAWSALAERVQAGSDGRGEQQDAGPLGGFLALSDVRARMGAGGAAHGLMIDLEGPVGQSVTALRLARTGAGQ